MVVEWFGGVNKLTRGILTRSQYTKFIQPKQYRLRIRDSSFVDLFGCRICTNKNTRTKKTTMFLPVQLARTSGTCIVGSGQQRPQRPISWIYLKALPCGAYPLSSNLRSAIGKVSLSLVTKSRNIMHECIARAHTEFQRNKKKKKVAVAPQGKVGDPAAPMGNKCVM
jgi:hypothetical protein